MNVRRAMSWGCSTLSAGVSPGIAGVERTKKEQTAMSNKKFPSGWDEDKIKRVLAHYEEQTEDEAVAEDEAGVESPDDTLSG